MVWLVLSGRGRLDWAASPLLGFDPSVTDAVLGEPVGWVTVAPVRLELTPASLNPNGDPATSSLIETVDPTTGGITRRPSPLAPRSAWLRSEITCLSPAAAPFPLRM